MAAPNETRIVEIKQEPPSPPEATEEPGFDDDAPCSPLNANVLSEQDDLPPVSDFLSVQIKEEPSSSPKKDSPPSSPTAPPRTMHANPVPISCLSSSMAAANHAAIEEDMVEAILPDRGPRSPSPELTFEMTATIKEEVDWDGSNAAKQGAENHNVPLKVKEEPADWDDDDAGATAQEPSAALQEGNHPEKTVYLVRTAAASSSAVQPRWTLKRKSDGSDAEAARAKKMDDASSQSANIKKIKERMKEYHQTKTCLENRIEALQNEKAEFEAKIKANTKASKLDQLQTDADRGVVKAKFLLDQLRCYGKGTYDWSEETLRVCKQWAKKFPQDYKQCSVDFLTLPTLAELGIKAGDTVFEAAAAPKEDDTPEDSEGSD